MNWDIQKVAKARVVLITGGEDVLRIQLLRELKEAIGLGEDDFDSEACSGDERPILDWVGSVSTAPFLADRRTLFVRAVYRADVSAIKKNPLLDIPDTGRLILIAEEDGGSEERNAKQKKHENTWTKWVQEAKGIVVACTVNDSDLAPTLQKAAKAKDKKITNPALMLLVEMTGGSLSRGLQELDKLAIFTGDHPEIREDDVRQVVTASREWNIWALIDAVREQRVSDALKQLSILSGGKQKFQDAAISTIMPQLSRVLKLLYQARICVEAGVQPGNAPSHITACFPAKPNLASERPGTLNRVMTQARGVSLDQIAACLDHLAMADARLKGAEVYSGAQDVMEVLIVNLAHTLRPQATRRVS